MVMSSQKQLSGVAHNIADHALSSLSYLHPYITMSKSQLHQAILARDMIDMARDNATNPDILEYIDSLCWELFMIFGEEPQKFIEWDILSGAYDQQYTALRNGDLTNKLLEVDDIYSRATNFIESHRKDAS